MAKAIRAQGADYALALKKNQGRVFADACRIIDAAAAPDRAETEQPVAHGRYESRQAQVVPAAELAERYDFPGIQAVARVTSRRRVEGGQSDVVVRHVLLSQTFSAKRVLEIVRAHWSIENQLHWVLDVVFDEDKARNRKDHGPENLSILRKLALNLIRSHPEKASIRRKVKRAGWDDAFLLELIAHMR